jgi:hypothetical protein
MLIRRETLGESKIRHVELLVFVKLPVIPNNDGHDVTNVRFWVCLGSYWQREAAKCSDSGVIGRGWPPVATSRYEKRGRVVC